MGSNPKYICYTLSLRWLRIIIIVSPFVGTYITVVFPSTTVGILIKFDTDVEQINLLIEYRKLEYTKVLPLHIPKYYCLIKTCRDFSL